MELDTYAEVDAVKKRYRALAKLYHPDRNPKNKHAEEYFKILTQGYNILSEADKKAEYDALLRNYYSRKPEKSTVESKEDEVRKKVRRHRENKRLQFIEDYVRAENEFPHRYRFVISIMVFFSGILMCYNHWFINLLNYHILYIVLGSFLFGLGAYLTAENVYKRRSFKKAMRIEAYGEEAGPVRLFILLFFMTPLVFLGLMEVTRTVHLKYFYSITVVKKVLNFNDELTYNYEVNGEEISRRTEAIPGHNYKDLSGLRVKFSRINPNISELVVLEHQR